ncbi:hypothetical protein [Agromyces humi]|uniref:hypothetical protein n=1 Tax=Agromyces humi TaxID=1766800 RepID=UPI00135C3CF5|nr:hypothetical protein [Agromyces humi]
MNWPDFWTALLASLLGALVGGGTAWLLARSQRADDRRARFDEALADLIRAVREEAPALARAQKAVEEFETGLNYRLDEGERLTQTIAFADRVWAADRIGERSNTLAAVAVLLAPKRDLPSAQYAKQRVETEFFMRQRPMGTADLTILEGALARWRRGDSPTLEAAFWAERAADTERMNRAFARWKATPDEPAQA